MMSNANQQTKFIPKPASIFYSFRTLLKKRKRFQWAEEHTRAFKSLQKTLIAISENAQYNRGNKTPFSRLFWWVDRLLPYSFEVQHLAGRNMGWADYISRSPSGHVPPVSHYDKSFSVAVCRHIKGIQSNCSKVSQTRGPNSTNHVRRPRSLVAKTSSVQKARIRVSVVAALHSRSTSHAHYFDLIISEPNAFKNIVPYSPSNVASPDSSSSAPDTTLIVDLTMDSGGQPITPYQCFLQLSGNSNIFSLGGQ